jgi:hypothetical protein
MAQKLKGRTTVTGSFTAADLVGNVDLDPDLPKSLKFQYDFADLGGTATAITLTDDNDAAQTIPDNAVVVNAWFEGVTAMTSEGSATVMLGVTGDTDAFKTATAFDDAAYAATAATAITNAVPFKTTAAVSVIATIAVAALTAGKFNVWVQYYEGD